MAGTVGASGSGAAVAGRREAIPGLSRACKDSFKLALSTVIAIGISLWMDWGHSNWAALAVVICSFTASGDSLNKGLLRMGGTVVAVFVTLLLVSLVPQDRWSFLFLVSAWVLLCAYMKDGGPKGYFWVVGGFLVPLLAIVGGVEAAASFETVMVRAQQTGMGIIVFSVVSCLVWPADSRAPFEDAVRNVVEAERQAVEYVLGLMNGAPEDRAGEALGEKAAPLLGRLPLMLDGAAVDSAEIRGKRRCWRGLLGQLVEVRDLVQRWHSSIPDVRKLDPERRLPGLGRFGAEIDRRFLGIVAMLRDQHPGTPPETVDPGPADMGGLSHFERAALVSCIDGMRRVDRLTAALFARVAYVRGRGVGEEDYGLPRRRPVFDPDRFLYAFRCFVAIWAAFLMVLYIPAFPVAVMFIVLTVSITLSLTAMPQLSPTMVQKPIFMGLAVIAVVYIFVMPQLSTFRELAIVLFVVIFGIAYKFPLPAGVLYRMTWLPLLVTILGVSNHQSYSFPFIASTAVTVLIMLWLVTLTGYLPVSIQPKDRFRAQLHRFFRSAGFLLGASQWRDRNHSGWMERERERFHVNEVSTIPNKMVAWCPALEAMGPEGVTNAAPLVAALQRLRRRIVEVHAAREVIRLQATALPESLWRELADWRDSLEQLFARLQADPRALDSASLGERLDTGVRDLEAEVSEFMESRAKTGPVFDEQSLYRLLAALRDISTSLVAYARRAEAFDWDRAYETRF